eukprot:CAMPEP_0202922314 /NCGR_PEP_ID=MMETSP1392-20130828/77858_1 /ASSEMBLY_ACC=CAM_ASM_000868 /TAXON_ID=225041 /ORGANISM="Chlamydomonas chlamydogama, Strain SAG 11-48b" /LENGTH=116 /DNA_ID=CAMNT_0049615933 /DNA_START=357 /DNA_END=707 /DNA_ORIENTATION=-
MPGSALAHSLSRCAAAPGRPGSLSPSAATRSLRPPPCFAITQPAPSAKPRHASCTLPALPDQAAPGSGAEGEPGTSEEPLPPPWAPAGPCGVLLVLPDEDPGPPDLLAWNASAAAQ